MESKQCLKRTSNGVCLKLLIEPVWNRNLIVMLILYHIINLLIEPVWNRNDVSTYTKKESEVLLIEPVWNRNPSSTRIHTRKFWSFNRTSMESKPAIRC